MFKRSEMIVKSIGMIVCCILLMSTGLTFIGSGLTIRGVEGGNGSEAGSEEFAPVRSLQLEGQVMDIAVANGYVFAACNDSGLQIVSLSSWAVVGEYNSSGLAYGISVVGNTAYLCDWDKGLIILDVSNPRDPQYLSSYASGGLAYKVRMAGTTAFLLDLSEGLIVLDVTNTSDPVFIGNFTDLDHATDCVIDGNVLYLVDWWGMRIISINDPSHPNEIANITTSGNAYGVDAKQDMVYVADEFKGLRIIDVSNPFDPHETGHYIADDFTIHVKVIGDYGYLANLEGGIQIVDIRDPSNVKLVQEFDTPGNARRVVDDEGRIYLADGEGGLFEFEQYQPPEDPPEDPNYWLAFIIIPIVAILTPVVKWKRDRDEGQAAPRRTGGIKEGRHYLKI